MLYPGETQYHTFTIPFASTEVSSVLVSYKQNGRVLIEKQAGNTEAIDDFTCRMSVSLSQAETMRFMDNEDITIQLNITGESGARVASKPII